MITIVFALCTAISFGTSDFLGGALSRRESAFRVSASSHIAMVVLYTALLLLFPAPFSWKAVAFGALAGFCSGLGVTCLYAGLARGVVGVVASVSAALSAVVPSLWGAWRGDTVSPFVWGGLACAIVAVIVLSQEESSEIAEGIEGYAEQLEEHRVPIMDGTTWAYTIGAGVLFSATTICFSLTPKAMGYWPLFGVGCMGLLVLSLVALVSTGGVVVEKKSWGMILLMAVLIVAAYMTQLLAVRSSSSLALVSVILGLYPVSTIVWARVIHKEKLTGFQIAGVFLALVTLVLVGIPS